MSKVVYAEIKCCLSCCKELSACIAALAGCADTAAAPQWQNHYEMATSLWHLLPQPLYLSPTLQFVTQLKWFKVKITFWSKVAASWQDVKQPQSWQSHSTARQAGWPSTAFLSLYWLAFSGWCYPIPFCWKLSHFIQHTSVMYWETQEMLPCWAHLCLTTAIPQAAVLMIWATFSACDDWEKYPGYDALETYWIVWTKSPVAAVSVTILVCFQIRTAEDSFT